MDIKITGKNMSVSEGMKTRLHEKLSKLEHYAPRIVTSHVILKKEKYLFWCELTLLAKNFRAYGDAKSKESILTAVDQAYLRIEKQLKKYREKQKDHHKQEDSPRASRKVSREVLETGDEAETPGIVRTRSFTAVEPMFPEDASLQLQDSSKPFLVFQNASTQKMNVIFKREDGNHGLIEPGF